jgi:hypothetical protein
MRRTVSGTEVRMRRILIIIVAVVVALGVPTVVLAATGGSSSSLDQQASRFTTNTVTTSSRTFQPVPGLSGLNVCALHQVTATLSVELNGAPAGFQIRIDGGGTMQPGAVRFVPAGPHDSFSFTFTNSVGPFEANDHHEFDVEWRSPTGAPSTLERGTFNLQYQRGTQMC